MPSESRRVKYDASAATARSKSCIARGESIRFAGPSAAAPAHTIKLTTTRNCIVRLRMTCSIVSLGAAPRRYHFVAALRSAPRRKNGLAGELFLLVFQHKTQNQL